MFFRLCADILKDTLSPHLRFLRNFLPIARIIPQQQQEQQKSCGYSCCNPKRDRQPILFEHILFVPNDTASFKTP